MQYVPPYRANLSGTRISGEDPARTSNCLAVRRSCSISQPYRVKVCGGDPSRTSGHACGMSPPYRANLSGTRISGEDPARTSNTSAVRRACSMSHCMSNVNQSTGSI